MVWGLPAPTLRRCPQKSLSPACGHSSAAPGGEGKSPGYSFFTPGASLSPVEADADPGQHVYPPNIPWQVIHLADTCHLRPPQVECLVDYTERNVLRDNAVKVDPPAALPSTLSGEAVSSWGWGTQGPGGRLSYPSPAQESQLFCSPWGGVPTVNW